MAGAPNSMHHPYPVRVGVLHLYLAPSLGGRAWRKVVGVPQVLLARAEDTSELGGWEMQKTSQHALWLSLGLWLAVFQHSAC